MPEPNEQRPTIGILYPGEMGASLGKLLLEAGFPVVTTLEGRGPRTAALAREAGLPLLDSLDKAVAASRYVVSLVPPAAAEEVAGRFAACAAGMASPPVYIDANSISPATVARIERRLQPCRATLVDAAIQGLASRLRGHGILYVSGSAGADVAAMLAGVLCVKYVGPTPGQASLLKMLTGGMAKGLAALFLEFALAAHEAGLLEDFLSVCRRNYSGVTDVAERLLPTFPRHARRRGTEMEEVERTIAGLGLRPGMSSEIRRLFGVLADSGLEQTAESVDPRAANLSELIALIASLEPLGVAEKTPATEPCARC